MSRRLTTAAGVVVLTLIAAAGAAAPGNASSVATTAVQPPVVTISVQGDQATISQDRMRPGVVEFLVGKTFTLPDSQGADTLIVVATEHLDQIAAAAAVGYDPSAEPAVKAAAMGTIRGLGTFYGGAASGIAWQVDLPAGNYFVLGPKSTVMGLAKPVPFTVAGEPRATGLHPTTATVRAVTVEGASAWATSGLGRLGAGWLKLANSTPAIHSLNFSGVKAGTTTRMVRRALQGVGDWSFGDQRGIYFDLVSPGVTVAIRGPFGAGRYFIGSFVTSETSGLDDAYNGMWKLAYVR